MSEMFYGCSNLIFIDLSSFNIKKGTDMSNIFSCTSNLKKIKINKQFYEKINNQINGDITKIEFSQ